MRQYITAREANHHLSQYIALIEKNSDLEVVITRRNKPAVKLCSLETNTFSEKKKAALARTIARMEKGINLGGKKFNRDELYER